MIKNIWSHTGARFIAVGITNTVIDFGILNFLVFTFGLSNLVANTISMTIAMAVSYMLNYHVVFRQKSSDHIKKVFLFLIVTIFGLWVLQNCTMYIFVHWLTWPASVIKSFVDFVGLDNLSKDFVILNVAKVIGTIVSMLWNFFMYKKYVFTDNSNDKVHTD